MHIIDHLDRAARNFPARLGFGGAGGDISFAEARSSTLKIARALLDDGFAVGTPFAVLSPNDSRTMVSILGAMRAGGAWCNITLAAPVHVNVDVLRRGACQVLFFHSSVADQIPQFVAGLQLRRVVCIDSADTGYPSMAQWSAPCSDAPLNVAIPADAVACQGTTGGTTGRPKLTQASHEFVVMSTLAWATCWQFDEPPVNLAVAPITHAGGMIALAQLQFGGTTLCLARPDIDELVRHIEFYRVTTVFLPPTLIHRLVSYPGLIGRDLSSLRYVVSASAPISPERIVEAVRALGPVVGQAYGQTEAGFPLTWMSPTEVARAVAADELTRLLSCGRPTFVCTALEAMAADGAILDPGATGEIVLRGPTTMRGYLGDPEATEEVQAYGWHHTGDIGHRDRDGYVFITDRVRDVIISGGFNIFPFEVERAILRLDEVDDCAVIGIPSDEWGESVHACVQLRTGAGTDLTTGQIISICKAAVGSIKAPKTVEFVADLPRSPVGKVLKRELRDRYWSGHRQVIG